MKHLNPVIPFYSYSRPILTEMTANERDTTIKQAAIRSLAEVGLAWGMNRVVQGYVAKEISVFGSAMLGITVCNYMFTAMTVYVVAQTALHLYRGEHSSYKNGWEVLNSALEKCHSHQLSLFSLVNLLQIAGPYFLVHESGHALTAWSCFLNANPTISITPFKRASTTYVISEGLTTLGNFLGKEYAYIAVTAAGITASLIAAVSEIGVAHWIHDKHPQISELLETVAYTQLFNDILYGLLAFGPARYHPHHDFVALSMHAEIHPLLPIGLLIAVPLFQKWMLNRQSISPSGHSTPV